VRTFAHGSGLSCASPNQSICSGSVAMSKSRLATPVPRQRCHSFLHT
jgi:hypothetical protein